MFETPTYSADNLMFLWTHTFLVVARGHATVDLPRDVVIDTARELTRLRAEVARLEGER